MALDAESLTKRLDMKDDQLFKLGDTMDVKASIALVIITFLATQTASFISDGGVLAWPWDRRLQLIAAVFLAVAGALAFVELWPRDYEIEPAESWDAWIGQLRRYYKDDPNAEQKVEAAVLEAQRLRTKERIASNSKTNEQKAELLAWSFRFTGAALALNLATLIVRAAH